MPVTRTLEKLGRLIRRTPPPSDLLEAYAHEVIPVLDRAEWLYQYWLEQSTLFTDSEKLGNVAAIHRWETATMGRTLERVTPPAELAGIHESVVDALEMASRAAQLLSNGSRFHNANAVCEGQAMLTASRERRLAALRSMRRYLSRVPPPAGPDPESEPTPPDSAASAAVSDRSVDAQTIAASTTDANMDPTEGRPGREAPNRQDMAPDVVSADVTPTTTSIGPARADEGSECPHDPAHDPAGAEGTPLERIDRTVEHSQRAGATNGSAQDAPSPDEPAPDRRRRTDLNDDRPSPRAGWGSLFGGPGDQLDR
jgi:hypothetical protein